MAVVKCLLLVCLLFDVCYCSLTTELLETVSPLLNHCLRFYSNADCNMAENLIVRREVALNSVHRLDDSLDKGAQANAERIVALKLLVRQLQYFLHRLEMLADLTLRERSDPSSPFPFLPPRKKAEASHCVISLASQVVRENY